MVLLTKDWIIGFVEGEGWFTSSLRKYRFPRFGITQKDEDILKEIQRFFGFGHIYYDKRSGCYSYQVHGLEELNEIVKFFDGYLRSRKRVKQFAEWKELIVETAKGREGPNRKWTKTMDMKAIRLAKTGLSWKEISTIFNKTLSAIIHRNRKCWHVNKHRINSSLGIYSKPRKYSLKQKRTAERLHHEEGLGSRRISGLINVPKGIIDHWIYKT